MPKEKMYKEGDLITNLPVLMLIIDRGEYVMWDEFSRGWQPKHPGVILSMTLFTLRGKIRAKGLRRAIKSTATKAEAK